MFSGPDITSKAAPTFTFMAPKTKSTFKVLLAERLKQRLLLAAKIQQYEAGRKHRLGLPVEQQKRLLVGLHNEIAGLEKQVLDLQTELKNVG